MRMSDYYQKDLSDALSNRGWTEDQIATLSPKHKFAEYCNWKGMMGWGERLWEVMEECKK